MMPQPYKQKVGQIISTKSRRNRLPCGYQWVVHYQIVKSENICTSDITQTGWVISGNIYVYTGEFRVTTALMKHDRKKTERKIFVWCKRPYHSSSLKEVRVGAQIGQEAGVRS